MAIISASYPDSRHQGMAVGVWNAVGALGLAIGPCGGLISEHFGWSWIFRVNLPVGAATIALGAWAIRVPEERRARNRIDLGGLLISGAALLGLTYALIEGHRLGWASPVILGCLAGALLLGVAFVVVETRVSQPMMTLSLFRDRVFGGGTATFAEVMPALVIIGIGGGFTTSLTATVVGAMPPAEAGAASALFNTVRQIGGLLGITVIGAILTMRQSAALRHGSSANDAFLSGYRIGLIMAAAFVAAGALAAYLAHAKTPNQSTPSADSHTH